MFEFLDNLRIGFFIIGDTLLFVLVLHLVSEIISEIKEGDKIEKNIERMLKKNEEEF